jgi:hypothetical protein
MIITTTSRNLQRSDGYRYVKSATMFNNNIYIIGNFHIYTLNTYNDQVIRHHNKGFTFSYEDEESSSSSFLDLEEGEDELDEA